MGLSEHADVIDEHLGIEIGHAHNGPAILRLGGRNTATDGGEDCEGQQQDQGGEFSSHGGCILQYVVCRTSKPIRGGAAAGPSVWRGIPPIDHLYYPPPGTGVNAGSSGDFRSLSDDIGND